jgi:spermidine synthase
MNNIKQSVQILADFKDCDTQSAYFLNLKLLKKKVGNIIKKSGFKVVKFCGHKFGNGGVSLVFIVSESHVAVHTWPEDSALNIDIFFCNYTKDNTRKAEKVFAMFKNLYRPGKIIKKNVKRYY